MNVLKQMINDYNDERYKETQNLIDGSTVGHFMFTHGADILENYIKQLAKSENIEIEFLFPKHFFKTSDNDFTERAVKQIKIKNNSQRWETAKQNQ